MHCFVWCVSLFCALTLPNRHLLADIAGFMTPSLPNVSSGGYAWSTWDFLTTPYIYPLLEENAVSAIITDDILRDGGPLAFAVKYTVPTPVYDIPLFFAFTLENQGSTTIQAEASANPTAAKTIETNFPYYQFIFGTSYGNFGLGVLIQIGRQVSENIRSGKAKELTYGKPINSNDFQKQFDGYGFEFGYINATNPSEGYAGVGSFLYKRYGGSEENIDENGDLLFRNNRPLLKSQDAAGVNKSTIRTGSVRNELEFHLLGWYHPIKILNLGASFLGSVAFASGYEAEGNNGTALSEQEVSQAIARNTSTVSGYFVNPVLFVDIDFPITSDLFANKIAGYFRLTPAFNYAREREYLSGDRHNEATNSTTKETVSFVGDTIKIDLSIKLAVATGSDKQFEVYLGWIPSIIIYESRYSLFDKNSDGKFQPENGDKESGSKVELGQLKIRPRGGEDTAKYALGCSYRPYKSVALHFNFIAESKHIKLGQINLSADYKF